MCKPIPDFRCENALTSFSEKPQTVLEACPACTPRQSAKALTICTRSTQFEQWNDAQVHYCQLSNLGQLQCMMAADAPGPAIMLPS